MTGLVKRWPLVVVALATVIGLAVADRADDGSAPERVLVSQEAASTAPGPEAKGGVWYCSEGTSLPGEFADHSVIVANPTAEAVTAAVSVFPATPVGSVSPSASPEEVLLNVPARSQAFLRLADVVESQYTAALVEIDSGSAVVEQRVQGPTGIDVMPCATRSSADWHFAAGSTRRDARLIFTLFNPFPDRAVVKFAFSTDEGLREPQALRGVLVPARSLVVVNATDLVPRFSSVSTTIESQAGRIVAGRLQLFDGTEGLEGLTAGPGVPRPQTQWVFSIGPTDAVVGEHIVLYNPSDREAAADISIRLDAPDPGGALAPFEVSVPPQQRVALVLREAGSYPLPPDPFAYNTASTLPAGVGFWASVQVYNGVPIVAERVAAASAAASPAGVAITAGVPVTAERYLIAGNRADESEVALAIVNPSPDSIARVTVLKLANGRITPIDQLDPREVAPHSRLVVPIDRLTDGDSYALLVEASQPVVVSRSLLARSGTGMASGASVPFDPMLLDPWAF
ncbi:MAG: hypothetical protein KTV68_13080 [Acidimicrobiia bacterium]|nr:hypothetical protein [Acidimicrobiia bacterium]MCY4432491.1 DUF5719 family protein [bacterium]